MPAVLTVAIDVDAVLHVPPVTASVNTIVEESVHSTVPPEMVPETGCANTLTE